MTTKITSLLISGAIILGGISITPSYKAEAMSSGENKFSFEILSDEYNNQQVDYTLWKRFIKYDLCISDYDSLTDKEKELCKFIFETERSAKKTVICERARHILKGDSDLGERFTLDEASNSIEPYYDKIFRII